MSRRSLIPTHMTGGPSAAARRGVPLASVLALIALAGGAPSARASAESVERPLPASDYAVRSVCSQPGGSEAGAAWLTGALQPARARCLALSLAPITPAARARRTPLGVLYSTPAARAHALAAARALARARIPAAGPKRSAAPAATGAGLAAEGRYGLTPLDLHHAYELPEMTTQAESQLVAVVDAYADPRIESDLATFDGEFGLPECSAESHCLHVVNLRSPSEPLTSEEKQEQAEWDQEISLDVETVHAICERCRILLVEASSSYVSALDEAESTALQDGATVISNSWGAGEPSAEVPAFNQPGVAITAAAGDDGYRNWMLEPRYQHVDYPAASPHVLAVGGTRLTLGPNGEWLSERVWNGLGATAGGCAEEAAFGAPAWQLALPDWSEVGCLTQRAVSDVSADADPYTGVAVYDSVPAGETSGWQTLGGTSLASPIIAATIALAGGVPAEHSYIAEALYENAKLAPETLHRVSEGSNGKCTKGFEGNGLSACSSHEEGESCSEELICVAANGYSGPVGLGTPHGYGAFAKPGSVKAPGEEAGSGSGGSTTGSTTTTTTTTSTTTTTTTSSSTSASPPPGASELTGAQTTTSASTATAATTTTAGAPGPSSATSSGHGAAGRLQIARLWLAPRTRRDLRSRAAWRRLRLRQIAFRALLSRPHRARALLYRLIRTARGHARPRAIGSPLALAGRGARLAGHLRGDRPLPPGRYRLALVLSASVRRTLRFAVR